MVNAESGTIENQNHELYGKSVKDLVLVFPKAVGSSVGAYIIYTLKIMNAAPLAVICVEQADIITASGCAISNIPMVKIIGKAPELSVQFKLRLAVDATNETIIVKKING